MNLLLANIHSLIQSDSGATAIEYGLLAGGVALGIVIAVFSFGSDLRSVFDTLGSSMQTVASNAQANSG